MAQVQALLQHFTGRRTVPNILLDFDTIGGSDEITLLHAEGGLQRKFQNMGVVPGYRANSPFEVGNQVYGDDDAEYPLPPNQWMENLNVPANQKKPRPAAAVPALGEEVEEPDSGAVPVAEEEEEEVAPVTVEEMDSGDLDDPPID